MSVVDNPTLYDAITTLQLFHIQRSQLFQVYEELLMLHALSCQQHTVCSFFDLWKPLSPIARWAQ